MPRDQHRPHAEKTMICVAIVAALSIIAFCLIGMGLAILSDL